jgi:hypothetical protein
MGCCFYVRSSVTWAFLREWGGGCSPLRGLGRVALALQQLRGCAPPRIFPELLGAMERWVSVGTFPRYITIKFEGCL